jgi:hypothetical protein
LNDKEYREQKRRVERFVEKWRRPMGLDWWTLKFRWDRLDKCELDKTGDGSFCCVAHTEVQWPYLTATITLHLPTIEEQSDKELESQVVHELCHVMVNEMRWLNAESVNLDHEERVVTQLAQAFRWVREEGGLDMKKSKSAGAGKPIKRQATKVKKAQTKRRMGMGKGNHG